MFQHDCSCHQSLIIDLDVGQCFHHLKTKTERLIQNSTCCWAFLNKRFNSSFIWSKKKTNQKELLSNRVFNFCLSDSADGSDDQPATADGVYEDSDDDISFTPSIPVRSSDCLFLLLFILFGLVSVLFSLSHIWLRIVKPFNAANLIKSYSFDQCSPQMTAFPKFLTTQQQSKFDRAGIIQFNLIQQKKSVLILIFDVNWTAKIIFKFNGLIR